MTERNGGWEGLDRLPGGRGGPQGMVGGGVRSREISGNQKEGEEVHRPSVVVPESGQSTHRVGARTKGLSFSFPLPQGMTPAEHPTPLKSSEEDVGPVPPCSNTPYPKAPSDHPPPPPFSSPSSPVPRAPPQRLLSTRISPQLQRCTNPHVHPYLLGTPSLISQAPCPSAPPSF